MLMQPTVEKLKVLNMYGMAEALQSLNQNPDSASLSFDEKFGIIVDREITVRYDKRQIRLLKAAKLRIPEACPEDINYEHLRGLERNKMITLIQCDWIKQHQNVIFTGPCGIGKTYLACALGQRACRAGISVNYFRMPQLFELLRAAQATGKYSTLMSKLSKIELIILDDFGLGELNMVERQDLLEVLESRNGLRSTAVTTQLPIDLWYRYIGDAMIADAILRRLLNCAHKIELDGEMLDQKEAQ
ncbi:MAG TPA: IS21-like element helper ATPase IstB [Gammaproteobacteria bacterium]|nr:IS21-like element helper ATPase IstB [Gammaproteobacteria bacterium]